MTSNPVQVQAVKELNKQGIFYLLPMGMTVMKAASRSISDFEESMQRILNMVIDEDS